MQTLQNKSRRGFSLIELVIVVVIIGILAAIAIPRLSRGAAGASDSAVSGNLAILRNAIDLYSTEHGGAFPTAANLELQLTSYSDATGATTSATKTLTCIYGPYLRKMPILPVGGAGYKGTTTVVDGTSGSPGATAGAWFYNKDTGEIKANTGASDADATGKLYNTY